MKITIIDGQGGKMGKAVIEQLKKRHPQLQLYAIGTNSAATTSMMKAGADFGATGENPCIVNAKNSDIIIGPIGIVMANSLLGEITPAIATAIGDSHAFKILIPVNRCNHYVVGCQEAVSVNTSGWYAKRWIPCFLKQEPTFFLFSGNHRTCGTSAAYHRENPVQSITILFFSISNASKYLFSIGIQRSLNI